MVHSSISYSLPLDLDHILTRRAHIAFASYASPHNSHHLPPITRTAESKPSKKAAKKAKATVSISSEEYAQIRELLKLILRHGEEDKDLTYPGMQWRDLRNAYLQQVRTGTALPCKESSARSDAEYLALLYLAEVF